MLVENNFISSREIKGLLDKNSIECEVVNCSSREALLDIAEKLLPDIVIIDFDFFINDSAEIVRELRHYSSKAYILAFIDPDHYEKLYQAIELGVDDYLVKPLQRDDVMLRIKMGLQRISVQFTKTAAMDTPVDADIPADEQSKKLFLDTDDTYEQQYKEVEKSFFNAQEVENKIEQLSEDEDSDFKVISEIPDVLFHEESLLEPAISEETAEKEITGELNHYGSEEELFSVEPEPQQDQFAIGEPWSEPEYTDAELPINDKAPADLSLAETDSLSGHNQVFTDDSQYFDELFRTRSDSESADIATEIEEPILSKTGLPDPKAKSKIGLSEESSGKLDDSKLFGMNKKGRTVDTKSFEEIFGTANVRDKRKIKSSSEHRTERDKQGKVEYLFSTGKMPDAVKTTSSESAVSHGLFDEDSYVKPTTYRQDREYSQKAKGSTFLKIAGNVLTASLLVLLITLSFFLIQSKINGGTPALAGYKMYVVLSGSMNPAFNTGSLVFVKSTDPVNITEGDIITFS
ncbi:MAG: signal peptidase I, partial [Clostridia bacterium]|nr:signal peptidase I [Clostridia bacterium]